MGLIDWLLGRDEPRPPDPERSVEAAWLPLWQSQMVLHELLERDVPAVLAEDHTSHLRFRTSVPMARIFVMEPRLEAAERIIEEITGFPPAKQGL